MSQFKNSAVAAKYTTPFNGKQLVHLPGGIKGNGFKTELQHLTLEQADRLFAAPGQNILQLTGSPLTDDAQKKTPLPASNNVDGNVPKLGNPPPPPVEKKEKDS